MSIIVASENIASVIAGTSYCWHTAARSVATPSLGFIDLFEIEELRWQEQKITTIEQTRIADFLR